MRGKLGASVRHEDGTYQLIGKEENGLQRELTIAKIKKVFQAGAEEIKDHSVVVALCPEPPDEGDTDTTSEGLVYLAFILELGMFSLDRLELDGDFLARDDVDAEVNIACRYI